MSATPARRWTPAARRRHRSHAWRSPTVTAPLGRRSSRAPVDVSDDVDDGPLRRRLAALVPDGVRSPSRRSGAEAFRDVDAVVLIFPTWRSNGDPALGRAIETLAAGARVSWRSRWRSARRTRADRGAPDRRGRGIRRVAGSSRGRHLSVAPRQPLEDALDPRTGGGAGRRSARGCVARRGPRRIPLRCASLWRPRSRSDPRRRRAGRRERVGRDPPARDGAGRLPVLVPAAPPLEHHHEGAALGRSARRVRRFLQSVQLAGSVDQARVPLASLFLWVQVLHAFDVPRRRDLSFSMVSSVILMAEAGALSLSSSFALFLLPWAALPAAGCSSRAGREPDRRSRFRSGDVVRGRWAGASLRGAGGPVPRRPGERAGVHGHPSAPGHARPVAAVLPRRLRVDRREFRRGRGEPVVAFGGRRRRRGLRTDRLPGLQRRRRSPRARTSVGRGRVPRASAAGGALAGRGVRHVRRHDVDDLGPGPPMPLHAGRRANAVVLPPDLAGGSDPCRPCVSRRRSTSTPSSRTCCSPPPCPSRSTSRRAGLRRTVTARSVRRSCWTRAWSTPSFPTSP